MGRNQHYTDHKTRRICDPLQESAKIVGAFDGSKLVGTIRANYMRETSVGYYEELFALPELGMDYWEDTAIITRFMALNQFRSSTIFVRLAANMFRVLVEDGIRWVVGDCNDSVLNLYLRLGFEIHKEKVLHPDYGYVTVLKIDTHDPRRRHPKKSLLTRFAY